MFFGMLNTPKNEFSHAKYHSKFSQTTHPIPTPQWPFHRIIGATIFIGQNWRNYPGSFQEHMAQNMVNTR